MAANNIQIDVAGEVEIQFKVGDLWTPARISDCITEAMLGVDFLNVHDCVWNFKEESVTIDGHLSKLYGRNGPNRRCRVIAHEDVKVPSHSEMVIWSKVVVEAFEPTAQCWASEAGEIRPCYRWLESSFQSMNL